MNFSNHPVASGPVIVTQPFGPPNWAAAYSLHNGIDFGGQFSVAAVQSGIVEYAGWDTTSPASMKGGYGQYVVIDHGDGFKTLYGHLAVIRVEQGAQVDAGKIVGISGSTGYSTGNHLHFGLKKDNKWIDPAPYLAAITAAEAPQDAALEPGVQLKVVGTVVNMRVLGSLQADVLGQLYYGTLLKAEGEVIEKDGLSWVPVSISCYMAIAMADGTTLLEESK